MEFDSDVQQVAGDSQWHLVATIKLGGDKSAATVEIFNSGNNSLSGVKVQRATLPSGISRGEGRDLSSNADFNDFGDTLSSTMNGTSGTPNIHLLPASGWGQFRLTDLIGVPEVGIYAMAGG